MISLIVLLFFIASAAKAQIANFSGKWKRNDEKTTKGGLTLSINSIPTSIEISQDGQAVTVKRNMRTGSGETRDYIEVLRFDGTPGETVTPSQLKRTSSIKWSADQMQIIEISTSKDASGNEKQSWKQTFSLSADKKTLTIEAVATIDGAEYPLTEVFEKE